MDQKDKYSKILSDVYENYKGSFLGYEDVPSLMLFEHEIKVNEKFSKKWNLKIEEKDLSLDERIDLLLEMDGFDVLDFGIGIRDPKDKKNHEYWDSKLCDSYDVPKKKVIMTYDNEIIQIFK
jgi:hypothetical protein